MKGGQFHPGGSPPGSVPDCDCVKRLMLSKATWRYTSQGFRSFLLCFRSSWVQYYHITKNNNWFMKTHLNAAESREVVVQGYSSRILLFLFGWFQQLQFRWLSESCSINIQFRRKRRCLTEKREDVTCIDENCLKATKDFAAKILQITDLWFSSVRGTTWIQSPWQRDAASLVSSDSHIRTVGEKKNLNVLRFGEDLN